MRTVTKRVNEYVTGLRLGFFLATRELKNANRWSTLLIVFIMTLTFLNLIVVRGLLVGLVAGVSKSIRENSIGDVFITNLEENVYVENSVQVGKIVDSLRIVTSSSPRYRGSVRLEANYKTKVKETDEPNTAGALFIGIDPQREAQTTKIDTFVFEGSYLEAGDYDQVLLGSDLLADYSLDGEGLKNIQVGSKILMTIGTLTREVTVKGLLDSKVEEISSGVFMIDTQARQLLNRTDYSVDEISIRLAPGVSNEEVKKILLANGIGAYAKVETFEESVPSFVQDITKTFALLANIISSISLIVAAITTFIIIFVNAITQRQLIGIMKGIGVHWFAIVSSYVMQAWFYASTGILFATIVIYGFLEPYVAANPIDFPFSDGILLVTVSGTLYRAALLMLATTIAGFVPARMIVNKNTLDSILGR